VDTETKEDQEKDGSTASEMLHNEATIWRWQQRRQKIRSNGESSFSPIHRRTSRRAEGVAAPSVGKSTTFRAIAKFFGQKTAAKNAQIFFYLLNEK